MSARMIVAAALATLAFGSAAHAHSATALKAHCMAKAKTPAVAIRGVHVPSRAQQVRQCIEEHRAIRARDRRCPANAPYIYRGNIYCLKGR